MCFLFVLAHSCLFLKDGLMIQHTEMPLVSEAEMAQFARAIGSDLFGEPEGPTLQSEEVHILEYNI